MRSIRIPDNQIYSAYLLEGTDMPMLYAEAKSFAETVLLRPVGADDDRNEAERMESVRIRLDNDSHPDFKRILPDRPEKNPDIITVGNIRENVIETAAVRPYESRYKVYVIEHAEKMNVQAQNALLKTLEEPPEYVVIILLAENKAAFLDTILSRVIEVYYGERDIREKAEAFSEQAWAEKTVQLLSEAEYCTGKSILDYIKSTNDEGVTLREQLSLLSLLFRDILYVKCCPEGEDIYCSMYSHHIRAMAVQLSFEKIGQITDKIMHGMQSEGLNVNRELLLEDLFLCIRERESL